MSYKNVKDFRQRLKDRAVYVMGNKCMCCGYDKCVQALEFHHLNLEEKDFSFGSNANRSWASTRNELQKCILVCANCHREIHYGLIDNSTLTSSFDEEKAKEIDALVDDTKAHKVWYCKECGAEVSSGNDCCPKCAHKKMRIADRPTREELKSLIRTTPFTQIGKMFNVSDNSIRKWCKAENLPSKVSEIKTYTDEEWEVI